MFESQLKIKRQGQRDGQQVFVSHYTIAFALISANKI
jgi:hypothetical protein